MGWPARRATFLWFALLVACSGISNAQRQCIEAPAGRAPLQVVREIDDPSTGTRWLLVSNSAHPGGPGHLLPVSSTSTGEKSDCGARDTASNRAFIVAPARPVIRGGDRLIVEENTPVAKARLAAMALGPATVGSVMNVRLTLGGKTVRVVALGPGRAELAQGVEGQR